MSQAPQTKARQTVSPPGATPRSRTLLEEADALRLAGNVSAARKLAERALAQGGPDAPGAERLLMLTGFPRVVLAYAGAAAAILLSLVTLANLRS